MEMKNDIESIKTVICFLVWTDSSSSVLGTPLSSISNYQLQGFTLTSQRTNHEGYQIDFDNCMMTCLTQEITIEMLENARLGKLYGA